MIAHLWESTLVAGAAWILCRLVLASNHPRVRFAVWLTTSIKFIVPFTLIAEAGRLLGPRPWLATPLPQAAADVAPTSGAALAVTPFGLSSGPASSGEVPSMVTTTLLAVWIPGVIGLWPSAILFLHEWDHARRRDNLTAAVHMAGEAVFWFHPVVWWIGRRLIEERERACDQAVLEDAAATDYAEAILNVCKWYHPAPLGCVAGVTGADLRARIETVRGTRPSPLGDARVVLLGAAWPALVLVPLIVGLFTAPPLFA
jgi:beta-lactamase regulating signal transducer with metallopeptidase domain